MAKPVVNPSRTYEEHHPGSIYNSDKGCDTIILYLPGYRKEQLKIQLTKLRILKISGERPICGDKWMRFRKELTVPTNCDTNAITARFEDGKLYIRQPKSTTPVGAPEQPADKEKAAAEAQKTPQKQVPDPPHPQPQQDRNLPHPLPQPQPEVPKLGPHTGFKEEKMEAGKFQEEAGKFQTGGGEGLFSELRKPENFKRLVISVLLVISIGFYATYMLKSFLGDEKKSASEYDREL